ncbi:MAG: polymerase sigma factor [Planctomycetaceae bacterium]|nr:polymerase sigma factor [Planctomycetaceae bacterium]
MRSEEHNRGMQTTPVSLLQRIRKSASRQDWEQLVQLCSPLLYHWVHRGNISGDEAGDLVQDVLVTLIENLPTWDYDGRQSFRGWLKTVTLNRCRDYWRKKRPKLLDGTETDWEQWSVDNDPADLFAQDQFNSYISRRSLEIMTSRFEPQTWKAFMRHAVDGEAAAAVALELGLTEGAVYSAKCRVMKVLRTELEGIFESS